MGVLHTLTPSAITLDDLAVQWLTGPGSELADSTLRAYSDVIGRNVVGRLGIYPAAAIDRPTIDAWLAAMKRDQVPPDARRRALKYLRMLLTYGQAAGHITANPALLVRAPKVPAREPVKPLSPNQVERIRAATEHEGRKADSIVIALMAYAGLRPSEAASLRWRDVGERSLMVRATKTNTVRPVAMLAPLASELRAWRLECGRPGESRLVVARPRVETWSRTTYNNWRRRVFDPACEAAGVTATPYILRHSFASLLIAAHYPVTYVAQQMRHSVDMTTRTYAHVIADLDPAKRIDPEQAIREAQGAERGHLTASA